MPPRARQRNGKHFSPAAAPGTPITPAEYAAAKARGAEPTNRAAKRAAKRLAKRAAAACPTPPLPRQEHTHVTVTADATAKAAADELVQLGQEIEHEARPTPPEQQKPGVRYCDGYEVVVDQPATCDALGSDGRAVQHTQMRELLLIDGRDVYGCATCDYWHAERDEVRAHLRTHNARHASDVDFLFTHLTEHGFDEGPFTSNQVRLSGLSRQRFPNASTVAVAMTALVADGRIVEVPDRRPVKVGIPVANYALATSKLAQETAQGTARADSEQPAPAGPVDIQLFSGLSSSTRRQYSAVWARFTTWCQEQGRTALPCSAETLKLYTADRFAAGPSVSTVKMDLTAIATVHRCTEMEAPDPAPALLVLTKPVPVPALKPGQLAPLARAGGVVGAPAADAAEAGDTPGDQAGDTPGDEVSPAGEHPGEHPRDTRSREEIDEANARLAAQVDAAAELRRAGLEAAARPTPAQVAAGPVDVMSLPLTALINRAQQVENYRANAAKANDKARIALDEKHAAEVRAREAESLADAAVREAEQMVDALEKRALDAEARAKAAEEALDIVRNALGGMQSLAA